jgi:hypothetical protein
MSSVMRFDEWQDSNGVPVLNGTGLAIPSSALPTGSILQVVSTTKTDPFSTTSQTFTDVTGLTATITPSSATSKIMILSTVSAGSSTGTVAIQGRLLRDSTPIFIGDSSGSRTQSSFDNEVTGSAQAQNGISALDSPNTTSAVTYKFQIRSTNGNTVGVNRAASDTDQASRSRTASSIILMEVAG